MMDKVKHEKCIECNNYIFTKKYVNCPSCKQKMCKTCSDKTIERKIRSSFYIQYENFCDSCIWFDMS